MDKYIVGFFAAIVLCIPAAVRAQGILATGVEQLSWTMDSQTSARGITLANTGARVAVTVAPGVLPEGTYVEMNTYASEYFLKIEGAHRTTPLYRVVVRLPQEYLAPVEGVTLPVQIKYPDEQYGKKSVWIWGDDDIWRETSSQSVPESNLIRTKISTGTTYFAVFSSDTVLEKGVASWYSYKNCNCAASPDYPKGTKLKVTRIDNGKSIVVKVNDFGPERAQFPDRVIDLDLLAFEQLAGKKKGLIRVKVEPL